MLVSRAHPAIPSIFHDQGVCEETKVYVRQHEVSTGHGLLVGFNDAKEVGGWRGGGQWCSREPRVDQACSFLPG